MSHQFMIFLNLALCSALGWSAICRLNKTHKAVVARVRIAYIALMLAATGSGLQFWLWGSVPDWDAIGFATALLVMMALSVKNWRRGVPQEFITDFGQL